MNIHNMSISRKVMLTLTAVLIVFLALQYLFLYKIILRDFESLQADIAIKDAKRCQDEIESELAHLKTLAIDWSAWDDTYNYIYNDDKKKYEKANLPDEIFTTGTFDLLFIFDNRGTVVFNRIYDPTKKKFIELNLFDINCFSINHWLLQHDSPSSSITGLIETKAGIMMLSSNPIVTSEFKGPINGTLIMGRFLNSEKIRQISDRIKVDFSISNKYALKNSQKNFRTVFWNKEKYFYNDRSEGSIRIKHEINGLNNLDLVLTSSTPDIVMNKGRAIVRLSLLFGIAISSISLLSVYLLLNGIFLKGITDICKFVKRVTETGNLSIRTKPAENHELKMLGQSINNMLDALEYNEDQVTRARIQAEKASQTKNLFLANMSHEIRTPMNAIIGFSDLLLYEELQPDQKQYVEAISTSGNNLLNLINDILDFSKIEAGKLTIDPENNSIRQIINEIKPSMETLAKNRKLAFNIHINKNLKDSIYTDPYRVKQCLINLIGNAIKFTEKGHVNVNIYAEDRGGMKYARFEVKDTGIGISPEKQKVIFESFTQEDATSTRVYGGTGLGLAITKQLAHLLGGELKMKSQKDKGSVFSLILPVGLDASSEIFHEITESTGFEEETKIVSHKMFTGSVLVAEDVKTNQVLLKMLLENFGLDITIVENGRQAVEETKLQNFDLILMDLHMPIMNGYEATRILKRNGIKTPIIALTANVIAGDRERCITTGCSDFLPKPIDAERLANAVEKFLKTSKRELKV